MATQTILISASEEYEKLANGIAELVQVDFVPPIVDVLGKTEDFTQVVLVIVVLSESYNHKQLFKNVIDKKIPMIFIKHHESLASSVYAHQATLHGSSHLFSNINPNSDPMFNCGRFLTGVHAKVPPKSSARKDFKKRVLLVGATFSGKSTVASLLINGSYHNGINPGGILVSKYCEKATSNTETFSNDEYLVTDTMGLGFAEDNETMNAINNLYQVLSSNRRGYHVILFFVETKRDLVDTAKFLNMFTKTLFPDMIKNFLLIYTFSEDSMNFLDKFPDPTNTGLKGFCTGIDVLFPTYAATCQRTLNAIKENIQKHTPEVPSVPELAWESSNSFFTAIKGTAQALSFKVMDNDIDKMSKEFNSILKH